MSKVERVKQLTEHHTFEELAGMVADLEQSLQEITVSNRNALLSIKRTATAEIGRLTGRLSELRSWLMIERGPKAYQIGLIYKLTDHDCATFVKLTGEFGGQLSAVTAQGNVHLVDELFETGVPAWPESDK